MCKKLLETGKAEIGSPINIRLGEDLLAEVDAEAGRRGISRAELIRQILTAALLT